MNRLRRYYDFVYIMFQYIILSKSRNLFFNTFQDFSDIFSLSLNVFENMSAKSRNMFENMFATSPEFLPFIFISYHSFQCTGF